MRPDSSVPQRIFSRSLLWVQVQKESEEKPQVFERYDVIRKRWVDVPIEMKAESEKKKTQVSAVAKPNRKTQFAKPKLPR